MSAHRAIAAIGGGHGLAATLAAVRRLTDDVTAIVSIADDGGSSGRLRDQLGIAPPGDLRKALVALADPTAPLTQALVHRFDRGDLAEHAFGNLLIAALTEVSGDLVDGLDEALRLLGGVGRIVPATRDAVVLRGVTSAGEVVSGQVAVMDTEALVRVEHEPADPEVPKAALAALEAADLVLLGPGSLFTSVLAAAATPRLVAALRSTAAPLVYVCNLRPQDPETRGMGVRDHVDALHRHGIRPDRVLYDPATIDGADGVEGATAVPLARAIGLAHDPELLAAAIEALDLSE